VVAAALAFIFFMAGILHFLELEGFARIVPPLLPWPEAIVIITGIYQIILSIAMALSLTKPRLKILGYAAAGYCVVVLPANIYQAVAGFSNMGLPDTPAILWARVALQIPFILLILWACKKDEAVA
jgi:uncharacterized membrane protein